MSSHTIEKDMELLRVLHVTNRVTPIGGAEKDLGIHLSTIEDVGHEAHIATCERWNAPEDPRIHFVPAKAGFRSCIGGAREIIELARSLQINVVHVANVIEFLGSRGLDLIIDALPTLRTIEDVRPICFLGSRIHTRTDSLCERPHGIHCLFQGCASWKGRYEIEHNLRRWLDVSFGLRTLRRTHVILAYSHHSKKLLGRHGIDAERVRVITEYCPVPGRRSTRDGAIAPPREPRTVLSVARLDRAKGQRELIRVARRLKGSGVRFDIAGEGPLRGEMESMIRAWGLEEEVRLLGRPDDVELGNHLERVGMLVVPSRVMETFVRTGVEANMAGRPVVAYDLGGDHEWLEDGINGLMVPYGDEEALAAAIITLADNPGRAIEMGLAGYERMSPIYSRERMREDLISAYRAAIDRWCGEQRRGGGIPACLSPRRHPL